MPATDTASRLTPYIEKLLDNEHARENLREGASQLRAAYERSKKRRVKAAPERRRGRRLVWLLGIVGVGVGAGWALATNEDLRSSLLGSSSHPGQPSEGS
jgi:hypothetical protein